jgi:phytoene desaturase
MLVANADLPYVYNNLLPDNRPAKRLNRKKYGCSAMVFHWGLDKFYPQLSTHNLFFAENIRSSFEPLFDERCLPQDPHFYVHAPSRADVAMAPAGGDTLTIALPCGHLYENTVQDWISIRDRTRKVVIKRLKQFGLQDLEQHIKFEKSFTPPDWCKRYNLVKGSTHGLSHALIQMGYLRPHNRHKKYRNIYFVGASTHPGTGLPCVLVSADLVTKRILQETGEKARKPSMTPVPA